MKMSLKNREWKEFLLKEICSVERGKRLIIQNRKKGNIPLVTAGYQNEGVADFIANKKQKTYQNSITIDMFGNVFFRKYSFKCDDNIHILHFEKLNKHIGIFISAVLNRLTATAFNYGKQFRLKTLEKQKILLPVNNNEPDYAFMEIFIQEKEQEKIKAYKKYITKRINELKISKKNALLSNKEWMEFSINEIFTEIQRGKRLKKADHKAGKMPYVSSTATNNGVDNYVSNKEKVRIFSDCLSLANSGSIGACFYQPYKFVASDHITKLANKDINKYVLLFLSTVVMRLSEKYSFNREINDKRIQKEKIILPINKNKSPDYDFMENYMKQLELKKIQKYLQYKNAQ